jgi:hypothetical protein
VKIKCPKCDKIAELGDDFSYVKCSHCSLDMTYGEYVKFIAYKDARYSDILGDYASGTDSTTGTIDDW